MVVRNPRLRGAPASTPRPIPMSIRLRPALLASALLAAMSPLPAQTRLDDAAVDRYIKARTADPAYPDASCFLGIVHFRFLGDAASAKPAIDDCKAKNPPAEVESFVDAISAEVDKALAG